jgi:phosphatidylglycerol lysyltransferase
MTRRRLLRVLAPIFGLAVFCLAGWALYRELHSYRLHDILHQLHSLPSVRVLLAVLFAAASYLAATGYDALGARYVQRPLPYHRTALAAFIGTTFSNNLGFGLLTGGSMRLRLYSAWGLSVVEISQLLAFDSLTLWLGFLTLGGLVFSLQPVAVPLALHLPFLSLRPVGILFLALVAAYLVLTVTVRKPLRVRSVELRLPAPGYVPLQVGVGLLDWILASATLYVLLPSSLGVSFPAFIGVYALALLAGVVSQVPGGLGVFETVFVLLLAPTAPASVVLGSLLAYRGVYYLLPLGVAVTMLAAQELLRQGRVLKAAGRAVQRWSSALVPPLLAAATLVGGAVLLFSGATAAMPARLAWLEDFLPLPVLEMSHFLGSVAGVGLLFLARGLIRRLDAAYLLTAALLAAGIVFSLLKGVDYEEAIILAVMLAALLPARRYFYRKSSLFAVRLSASWLAAMAFVIIGTLWLTLFAHKHVEYSNELWWHFTFKGNAPRALRALSGAVVAALVLAVASLLRPRRSPRRAAGSSADELERVLPLVRSSPQSHANLALLGDKRFQFSPAGGAFLMYRCAGRSWVVMGDPVGRSEEWRELVWSFREQADRYGAWTVFYEVSAGHLDLYLDLGLTLLKLGEEARVPLTDFSLEGRARKGLRYTVRKLEAEGAVFEVAPAECLPGLLPELKEISDQWLEGKNTREKSFSLGSFREDYLRRFPAGLVRMGGRIAAFTNLWAGDNREELSVDLMRHLPQAPPGVMEYMFTRLMLWGRERGYLWFNLGMVPLAGLVDHALAPLWNRIGTLLFSHGEHFYNFQGLRHFKQKFDPQWSPRYLASPGGLAVPRILTEVAALTAGGLKGMVAR